MAKRKKNPETEGDGSGPQTTGRVLGTTEPVASAPAAPPAELPQPVDEQPVDDELGKPEGAEVRVTVGGKEIQGDEAAAIADAVVDLAREPEAIEAEIRVGEQPDFDIEGETEAARAVKPDGSVVVVTEQGHKFRKAAGSTEWVRSI